MTKEDLVSINEFVKMINRLAQPESRAGDYVSFVDDNDEWAGVKFCRKDGHMYMWMPTEDYLDIVKYNQEQIDEQPKEACTNEDPNDTPT